MGENQPFKPLRRVSGTYSAEERYRFEATTGESLASIPITRSPPETCGKQGNSAQGLEKPVASVATCRSPLKAADTSHGPSDRTIDNAKREAIRRINTQRLLPVILALALASPAWGSFEFGPATLHAGLTAAAAPIGLDSSAMEYMPPAASALARQFAAFECGDDCGRRDIQHFGCLVGGEDFGEFRVVDHGSFLSRQLVQFVGGSVGLSLAVEHIARIEFAGAADQRAAIVPAVVQADSAGGGGVIAHDGYVPELVDFGSHESVPPAVMQSVAGDVITALVLPAIVDFSGDFLGDVRRDVLGVNRPPVVPDTAVVVLDGLAADRRFVGRGHCLSLSCFQPRNSLGCDGVIIHTSSATSIGCLTDSQNNPAIRKIPQKTAADYFCQVRSPLCACESCECAGPCVCGTVDQCSTGKCGDVSECLCTPARNCGCEESQPSGGPLVDSIVERFERRAERIEAHLERANAESAAWRDRTRFLDRFDGKFLDRIGTLLRGVYWLAIVASGAVSVACIAYAMRQLADVVKSVALAVKSWRQSHE